jgi:hypothetical protein
VSHQGQDLTAGEGNFLQPPIEDGRIVDRGQATLDQFGHRPLVAWPDQPSSYFSKQGGVVAFKRLPKSAGPGGGVGERHLKNSKSEIPNPKS